MDLWEKYEKQREQLGDLGSLPNLVEIDEEAKSFDTSIIERAFKVVYTFLHDNAEIIFYFLIIILLWILIRNVRSAFRENHFKEEKSHAKRNVSQLQMSEKQLKRIIQEHLKDKRYDAAARARWILYLKERKLTKLQTPGDHAQLFRTKISLDDVYCLMFNHNSLSSPLLSYQNFDQGLSIDE